MIENFLKVTGNEFATLASEMIVGDVSGWIDSGSYTLNAVVSGDITKGFPKNKIISLCGEPGTGKTFFVLGAAKNFLDNNETGCVICFESEGAYTKEMLLKRGIDVDRFGVVPVSTVQEFRTQALRIIDEYEKSEQKIPLLLILDSLGMLSTIKEMEDSLSGTEIRDMTRAAQLKSTFRVLTLRLSKANVPLLVTNHVYSNIGNPYSKKSLSGGSALVYSSSIILYLTKSKERDSDGDVNGSVITLEVLKSRLIREFIKVKTMIKHHGGLDKYYGLLDIATDAGIFRKVSTKYELPTGEKVYGSRIYEEPEKYFTEDVLSKINEYVKDNFSYQD